MGLLVPHQTNAGLVVTLNMY